MKIRVSDLVGEIEAELYEILADYAYYEWRNGPWRLDPLHAGGADRSTGWTSRR